MNSHEMTWQSIVARDPFLAGSIAAREHKWFDLTAEEEADSIRLIGEQRDTFLAGWNAELAEQERERIKERAKERDDLLEEASGKGDPAA